MNQPDFQLKQQNFSGVSQFARHGIAYVREPESRYVTPENGLITDLGLL
jgi:hypothetical protein